MKLSITVLYKNEPACYSVVQEAAGVYLASLEWYEGLLSEAPPTMIMLVKGIRRWTGSFEHQELLNDLGKAIESNLHHGTASNNLHENRTTHSSDM